MTDKILLINPGAFAIGDNEATILPPLGLMYIATALNNCGFKAQVYDADLAKATPDEAMAAIKRIRPRVVGARVHYYNLNWTMELVLKIRELDNSIIVGAGGPIASYSPREIVTKIGLDFAISGEGESPMKSLAQNLRNGQVYYKDVPGITARQPEGGCYTGPQNRRIDKLDELPFPDYDLVGGPKAYSANSRYSPAAALFTSRGCPFQCTFCSKHVFGSKVALRSAENVISEIFSLKNKYGVRQIDIIDDNFTVNREYFEEVLDLIIKNELNIFFDLKTGVRIESLDEAVLDKMKKAGFYKMAFGIESADTKVLDLCKKQLDLDKLKRIAKYARKIGFRTSGFFIIGLPGETRESVKMSVLLAKEIGLDVANFCMATPYPGTALYDFVKTRGRFLFDPHANYDFGFYGDRAFYTLQGVDENEILLRYEYAYRAFYTPGKIIKNSLKIRSFGEFKWFCGGAASVFRGKMHNLVPKKADIDSPQRTESHARIIRGKRFLRKLYTDWYLEFKKTSDKYPEAIKVELGSGGGFIKDVIPDVYTSDILLVNGSDINFSVFAMPFKENSVSVFLMQDVLHHVSDAAAFFKELNRCLKTGGRVVMIEPANTVWSRFIYKNFQHEPFDAAAGWAFKSNGPLSSANGALAWIIFFRDRDRFENEFSSLLIKKISFHTPLRFLASGGISMPQLLPSFAYGLVNSLENILLPLGKYLGLFLTIELEKVS